MLIRNTWLILLPRGAIFSSSDKLELGKVKWSNESYQMLMHMEDRCDMFKQNHLPSLRPWSCIDRPFIYGLTTAELPWWQDIHRSLSNSLVCDRVKAINMIIWDEASMSSRRIFELVNLLHHDLADDLCHMYPFAGKQLILVGEFLQLQPVPNMFDEGCYMFELPLFDHAISHGYQSHASI